MSYLVVLRSGVGLIALFDSKCSKSLLNDNENNPHFLLKVLYFVHLTNFMVRLPRILLEFV